MRLVVFLRGIVHVIYGSKQAMILAYLLRGDNGINGRLCRSLFLLARFGTNERLNESFSANLFYLTRGELSAYVDVLSRQPHVAVGISKLF